LKVSASSELLWSETSRTPNFEIFRIKQINS